MSRTNASTCNKRLSRHISDKGSATRTLTHNSDFALVKGKHNSVIVNALPQIGIQQLDSVASPRSLQRMLAQDSIVKTAGVCGICQPTCSFNDQQWLSACCSTFVLRESTLRAKKEQHSLAHGARSSACVFVCLVRLKFRGVEQIKAHTQAKRHDSSVKSETCRLSRSIQH